MKTLLITVAAITAVALFSYFTDCSSIEQINKCANATNVERLNYGTV